MKKHLTNAISKKRALQKKAKPMPATGAEIPFFMGGDKSGLGRPVYNCPRFTKEYQQMRVRQIFRRALFDIDELLARAMESNPQISCVDPLKQELGNHTFDAAFNGDRKATKELDSALKRLKETEPKNAACAAAVLARHLCRHLENLTFEKSAMMREIAKECSDWPINLSLTKKNRLRREEFAKKYLQMLAVNTECKWPPHRLFKPNMTIESPYTIAAENLYKVLLMMKRDAPAFVNIKTQWARDLRALPEPMTRESFPAWWKVARTYLVEQWQTNRSAFDPLISCLAKGKIYTPSDLMISVIDRYLKSAFKSHSK